MTKSMSKDRSPNVFSLSDHRRHLDALDYTNRFHAPINRFLAELQAAGAGLPEMITVLVLPLAAVSNGLIAEGHQRKKVVTMTTDLYRSAVRAGFKLESLS